MLDRGYGYKQVIQDRTMRSRWTARIIISGFLPGFPNNESRLNIARSNAYDIGSNAVSGPSRGA
jgi:hypothetical protein